MTDFPTLIEFIDEFGLRELHACHEDYQNDMGECSFDYFVKEHYVACKEAWHEDMNYQRKMKVKMGDNDISLELAKLVMAEIINKGLANNLPKRIILNDDLAPEYHSAPFIINDFNGKVIPAIEKCLNDLGA